MGVCSNCIYIGDKIEEPKRKGPHSKFCYEYTRNGHRLHWVDDLPGPDYRCKNVDNAVTDFVTGEKKLGSCRIKNCFGECPYFDDGSVDIYAWKRDEYIIYTASKTPKADDEYYNNVGDKLGTLTNIAGLYAWVKDDTVLYTLTATPLANYSVYDAAGNELGTITEVSETTVTVADVVYTRTADSDIANASVMLDSDFYFRSAADDTKVIIPEEE